MANRWWNNGNSDRLYFLGLQNHCSHEIKRRLFLGRNVMTNLDSILKSRHYPADKGPSSQSHGFSSSHVWMWELDNKESWVPKNWCFWTLVLEKTLESPLDCKEIQPVHPKGNQPEYSLEGLMLKLKFQYFGHLMWRTVSSEKTWCWERSRAGGEGDDWGWDGWWHHWFDGHEFEQALGVYDGQGSLACCSPWGYRVGQDWAAELNWWRGRKENKERGNGVYPRRETLWCV